MGDMKKGKQGNVAAAAAGLEVIQLEGLFLPDENNPISSKKIKRDMWGRPTKMTKQVLAKLESAFKVGATDQQACGFAGISVDTLYRFERKFEDFRKLKDTWKQDIVLQSRMVVAEAITKQKSVPDAWSMLRAKEKGEFAEQRNIKIEEERTITVEMLEQAARGGTTVQDIKVTAVREEALLEDDEDDDPAPRAIVAPKKPARAKKRKSVKSMPPPPTEPEGEVAV